MLYICLFILNQMSRILKAIIQDLNNEIICTNLRCEKDKDDGGIRKPEDSGFVYGLAVAKDIVEKWLKITTNKNES
jgi:hypothetical protein